MAPLDLSRLSPSDAITALRTYPRRIRATIAPLTDEAQDPALATMPGHDGTSACDIVAALSTCWDGAARAIKTIHRDEHAVVERRSIECLAPITHGTTYDGDAQSILEAMERACGGLVDYASRLKGHDWKRSATTTAGADIDALVVLHRAVQAGRDALDHLEVVVAAVLDR